MLCLPPFAHIVHEWNYWLLHLIVAHDDCCKFHTYTHTYIHCTIQPYCWSLYDTWGTHYRSECWARSFVQWIWSSWWSCRFAVSRTHTYQLMCTHSICRCAVCKTHTCWLLWRESLSVLRCTSNTMRWLWVGLDGGAGLQVCCVQDPHLLAVRGQDLSRDQQLLGCQPPLLDQGHSLLWTDPSSGEVNIWSRMTYSCLSLAGDCCMLTLNVLFEKLSDKRMLCLDACLERWCWPRVSFLGSWWTFDAKFDEVEWWSALWKSPCPDKFCRWTMLNWQKSLWAASQL